MFIQTEATPNPATLKFLPGRVVLPEGTLRGQGRGRRRRARRWRRALFDVPGVAGVYFGARLHLRHQGRRRQRVAAGEAGGARRDHGALPVRRAGDGGRRRRRPRTSAEEFYDAADHDTVGDDQGPARNPGAPGRGPRRRRHPASFPIAARSTSRCTAPAPAARRRPRRSGTACRTCSSTSCRRSAKSRRSEAGRALRAARRPHPKRRVQHLRLEPLRRRPPRSDGRGRFALGSTASFRAVGRERSPGEREWACISWPSTRHSSSARPASRPRRPTGVDAARAGIA